MDDIFRGLGRKARNLTAGALAFTATTALEPNFEGFTLLPMAEAQTFRVSPESAELVGRNIARGMSFDSEIAGVVKGLNAGGSATLRLDGNRVRGIARLAISNRLVNSVQANAFCQNVASALVIIRKSAGGLILTVTYYDAAGNVAGNTLLDYSKN